MTPPSLLIFESAATQFLAVDFWIGNDTVLLKVRETNWTVLRSWEGGEKWFWRDQNKDKNTSKPTPNTPTSFNGEYKYKEEREGDPSSFQSCLQQLHVQLYVAFLFLIPNGNLNQTSRECLVNVWGRVETLREDWTAA